ncbi:MAG: bifunctional rhamnulose-1-phosphate aldolase/short-chain dehydrogenase, partial [Rhodobacteraceae bacterium]|nr:bifunctional rhamnulose-1-phosphate aldolase/short-chain dehydrogenase [Paracoccaceae bacterium]
MRDHAAGTECRGFGSARPGAGHGAPAPIHRNVAARLSPATHVDHTHPDAIISLACTPNGRELCHELWGDKMVWVDYIRPGFTLSKWIGEGIRANPHAELVIMGKHGLVNWGETSRECYDNSIRTVQEAEDFIASRRNGRQVYVSAGLPQLSAAERRQLLAQVLPGLRGAVSKETPAILKVDDSDTVLEFVNSQQAANWSQIGAACPDHLVHTKRTPLFVDWSPAEDVAALTAKLNDGVAQYMTAYRAYFDQCKHEGDEVRDPAPRVILIPGLGMVNTGPDALGADVSNQLYQRAIAVIEGSQSVGEFVSLTPQEAFDIEYWPLELYKLKL